MDIVSRVATKRIYHEHLLENGNLDKVDYLYIKLKINPISTPNRCYFTNVAPTVA